MTKKNIVNVLKSEHDVVFFSPQNAYKCSCSPKTYVEEVVPEHIYIFSAQYENMDSSRTALRFLGIPILLRIIRILKTRSTILELSVRVLGIGTIWQFLKCAVKFGHFWNF